MLGPGVWGRVSFEDEFSGSPCHAGCGVLRKAEPQGLRSGRTYARKNLNLKPYIAPLERLENPIIPGKAPVVSSLGLGYSAVFHSASLLHLGVC